MSAYIKSISQLGEVEIKFSTNMRTENLNLTHINSTIVDAYIRPHDDWHLREENFNLSTLNFTWNVTSYQNDTMWLQIVFNNPLQISPLGKQDFFVFHVKERGPNFMSLLEGVDLHDNYTTLDHKVRKQLPLTQASKDLLARSDDSSSFLSGSLIFSMVLNIFFAGSKYLILMLINSL